MKKTKAITIITTALLSIAIAFFAVVFSLILPGYLEKKIIPDLVRQTGIEGFSLSVRRIGFTGADLAMVRIGEKPGHPLCVSSVQIDYSLFGLFNRHLKSIHVCGLSLNFELTDGKFFFPGIDLDKLLSEIGDSAEHKVETKPSLPISVDRIVVKHSAVTAKINHTVFRLPLDVTLLPVDGDLNVLTCIIDLYPFNETIRVEARFDFESGNLKILGEGQNLRLENYVSLLTSIKSLQTKGGVDFRVYAGINLDPFDISTVNINLESSDFSMKWETLALERSMVNDKALIRIQGDGLNDWKISMSGLAVISPAFLDIPEIRADVLSGPDGLEGHFQMDTLLKRFGEQKTEIHPSLDRRWNGVVRLNHETDWFLNMQIIPSGVMIDKESSGWYRIIGSDMDVGFFLPHLTVSGEGNLKKSHAKLELGMADTYVDMHAVSIELPTVNLNAEWDYDVTENKNTQQFNFQARLINTGIRIGGATHASFPDISLTGHTVFPGLENAVHAIFKIAGGNVSDTMHHAGMDGVTLELPLIWPLGQTADPGFFKIDVLRFREKNLGKIRTTLRQDGNKCTLKGVHESRLLAGLALNFQGHFETTRKGMETRIQFEIPNYKPRNALHLGDFFSGGDGIFIDGRVGLTADFYKLGAKMASSAHIDARDIHISMKEPEVAVHNVRIDLTLEDLFDLRSLPHQHVKFDSARIGNIELSDGVFYFQMQAADRFFVEKTSFKWCGGNVDTNAAVVSIPIDHVGFTLYCDRLKLDQVLKQLGGIRGEGEGTVNGRIPVKYSGGKIIFDNGFLYSTPGDGGTIRLIGTEALMAGIPEGTPQFSQIDLAREALKHYLYDWAKLEITTEQDNLVIKLKTDGKPADILPFEYRQDFGGFVRVDADSPGSRFQGIRLDVNFNFPLERVLKYGKGFQDIFKMGN